MPSRKLSSSPSRSDHLLVCTFCKKDEKTVKKLIAGPGVYICDECVALCNRIIEGKDPGVPFQAGTPLEPTSSWRR